jgi:hypothetical protein
MPNDLNQALRQHQHGWLDPAARMYHDILAVQPDHADALHLLGVVLLQQGDAARAVPLIDGAIANKPGAAAFHANLGEAHRALSHLDQVATFTPAFFVGLPRSGTTLTEQILAPGQCSRPGRGAHARRGL